MRRVASCLAAALLAGPALAQMPEAPPVDVATPLQKEVTEFDTYTGRFEAVAEVEIVARVSGYLEEIHFEDGQIVEKGDPLFTIDRRTFEAAVARAEAQLASAKATRDLAVIERDRAVQLAERNVGTAQEVDRTNARLGEAEAAVAVAEAELTQARLDLDFTDIAAPVSGRMSDARLDAGNLVVGGAQGASVLTTVVAVDPIHFVFTASEADFLRYSRMTGDGARRDRAALSLEVGVRLMDEEDFVHSGRMNFVDNRLDPNSGTITGRAAIPNPEGFLVPGLFGQIRLPARAPYEALLIPDTAILSDQASKIVMVVDGEGTVSQRTVELGPLEGDLRVIRQGLSPEDRVVVAGVQRARPGGKVTPQEVALGSGGD